MLTPIDIDNKEFTRQFKGYNVEEVDIFLDQISDDLEILMKEKKELESKLDELEKSVKQYQAVETTLQDTLIIAQKTAEDVKNVAKKEAEQIISSAQELSKQAIEEMNLSILKKKQSYEKIKQDQNIYKAKMESLLISQLELLSELDSEDFIPEKVEEIKEKVEEKNEENSEEDIKDFASQIELEKKLKELEMEKEKALLNLSENTEEDEEDNDKDNK